MSALHKFNSKLRTPRCSLCLLTKGIDHECTCDYSKFVPDDECTLGFGRCFNEPVVPDYGPEAYEEIELSYNNTGCVIRIVHDTCEMQDESDDDNDDDDYDADDEDENHCPCCPSTETGKMRNRFAQVDPEIFKKTMMARHQKKVEMCYKGVNELDSDIFVVKLNSKNASETKRKTMEVEMLTPKYVPPKIIQKESCGTQIREQELEAAMREPVEKRKKGKKNRRYRNWRPSKLL